MSRPAAFLNQLAKALVDRADDAGALEPVISHVKTLTEMFVGQPRLRQALERLPSEERQTAFMRATKGLHAYAVNSFLSLMDRGELRSSVAFAHRVASCAAERGYVETRVTTATDAPELIGGSVTQIGDQRIDASINGILKRLNAALHA